MSLRARQELSDSIRVRYAESGRKEKTKILDEFTAATGYGRKHAIAVISRPRDRDYAKVRTRASPPRIYTDEVQEALVQIWEASNRLCSKRFVPYLPTFVRALERCGHLKLKPEVKRRLLGISTATVDRLLYKKRHGKARPLTTTRRGRLLKHQIPIRTFTDWDEDKVGFLEADSVAHCGTTMAGTFINSFVLTDIKTGWTECLALLYKDQDLVVRGLEEARRRFPFPVRGLDTDNGSEFITGTMVKYCEKEKITFTRSRPYKKNDQCFVEQKNGQIVRRLIGYDRYEGVEAARAMAELYAVIRLYTNFFQPSMRLVSKSRDGAKVRRLYDKPRTPYERVLLASEVASTIKGSLRRQYHSLDPVALLKAINDLQDALWAYGYRESSSRKRAPLPESPEPVTKPLLSDAHSGRTYRRRVKKNKKFVHWWRTKPDAFLYVWGACEKELALQPDLPANVLLQRLQVRHPGEFPDKLLRTMQRRVRAWRIRNMEGTDVLSHDSTTKGDSLPDVRLIELVVPFHPSHAADATRYDFE